jgi:CBS domain-containing protein
MRPAFGSADHPVMRVEKIMTRDVVTVAAGTPLKEVAALLAANHISGVPVADPDGTVLGVVSEADILCKEQGFPPNPGRVSGWLLRRMDGELDKIGARRAADAMTAPALTVRPAQQVSEVARLMVGHRINRLPVVADGRLVGIVSRADLVRAFNRPDAELEHEIREEVLFGVFVLSPDAFDVTVKDGVVRIEGTVRTAVDAESITRHVRGVPGVLDVTSELDWPESRSSVRAAR